MSIDPKKRLRELLIELFQLDKTDLDFGVYRIMNLRAKDVNHFIDEILPAKLNDVSTKLMSKSVSEADAEAGKAKAELLKLGVDETDSDDQIEAKYKQFGTRVPAFKQSYDQYKRARESIHRARETGDLERDIYNDLFRFFDRYYEEGDFVTKPRAGDATFMIPYNGEETKFYWANYDQYYIKTGENFKNYVFTNREQDATRRVIVEFKLIEAETALNNNQNQKGRVFVPAGEDYFQWDAENRKLTLLFYYKVPTAEEKESWGDQQSVKTDNKGINEKLVFTALENKIRETGDAFLIRLWETTREVKTGRRAENQNEFYRHLKRYTTINSFDYFIHKNLRKFLRQELDYFLKHEIFTLNFLADDWSEEQTNKAIQQNLVRASVIRDVAAQIIDFLAEIEDFQKRLYEKKKFVVASDYCLTLDLIPAACVDEIIAFVLADAEGRQLREWQKLGFIESAKVKAADLKADGYLVLDTQFLPAALKFKLLSEIENLDEKTSGLLINSDNWQALNFLSEKYKGKIKCVYIDPPYNTPHSRILYKNNYLHSTWLTLISQTLSLALHFLTEISSLGFAIDDFEQATLTNLLDDTFPNLERSTVVVNHHPQGAGGRLSRTHEYYIILSPPTAPALHGEPKDDDEEERNFMRSGTAENNFRHGRWRSFYALLFDRATNKIVGAEEPPELGAEYPTEPTAERLERIYPINSRKEERVWRASFKTGKKQAEAGELIRTSRGAIYQMLDHSGKRETLFSNWTDSSFNAGTSGTNVLSDLGLAGQFDYPKSLFTVATGLWGQTFGDSNAIVLDYFAGSGTTGHAVIYMNRSHYGNRKYILVEMGEYFDTVTKPRIQKVIYSADWKNGKPVRNDKPLIENEYKSNGTSHIFQYLKLEQYEDTLNNIEFDHAREQHAPAFEFAERIQYLLRYGTNNSPSLLAIDKFNRPFEYEMDIIRLNERQPTRIDLVTTFNFLLGIDVVRYRTMQHQNRAYRIIEGIKKKQAYLIVWRDFTNDLDLAAERDFIKQSDWFDTAALRYANADNAFGADSTEAEFKRLMFEATNPD